MTTEPTNPNLQQGQAPQGGQGTPGQAPTSTPQAGNEPTQPQLSYDDALRLLAETRREAAEHRVELNRLKATQKQQEDAAAALEQQRLAEQGQFKQLAEQREMKLKELEPEVERLRKLSEQVKAQILAETKDWPKEVKAFYPGDDATADALQDWYNRSKPLLAILQQQAQGQQPGMRQNPPAANREAQKQAAIEKDRQVYGKALRALF